MVSSRSSKSLISQILKAVAAVLVAVTAMACQAPSAELRLLGWIGYDEKDLLDLIKSQTGVTVVVEPFVGGDQMFANLTRNPESFDLVVVDPEYVAKLAHAGVIRPLESSEFEFADYFPSLQHFDLSYVNGELYSVLVRFGINGLLYNKKFLTAEDVASYQVLKSPKLKGRIVLFDWYLPNMGVFSRILGHSDAPYELNEAQFDELANSMRELRPSVKAIQSSFTEMVATLASGDAWVQPTAGESLVWSLRQTNPDIDWTLPEEGGILWCETLAIPTKARNASSAVRVIRFLQSPTGQAALVRRKAYISSVPNEAAYPLLSDEEKAVLKIEDRDDAEALLAKVSVRRLPVRQSEGEWQRAWTAFKAGN